MWTKTSQSIGLPSQTPFSKEEELVTQKAFFDHLWHITLEELCGLISLQVLNEAPRMPDLSKLLNEDAELRRDEMASFQSLFLEEIYFSLDYISPILIDAMKYVYTKGTGGARSESKSESETEAQATSIVNLVRHLFRLKKEGDNFPTLKVGAGVHAAVRMDRRRRFVANDYIDFRHAQAAVPYCNYFFTENNLRHLLNINTLSYDKEYNCEIVSKKNGYIRVSQNVELI